MTTRRRKRLVREARLGAALVEFRKTGLRSALGRLKEAGRVLSAANEEKLRTAADAIAAVLAALEKVDATAEAAADSEAKCETCKGSGSIREGNVECPDCGGSGLAKDVKKEARRSRLLGIAEAYSSAAMDACDGADLIAWLLELMSEESDEPGELSILQAAYMLLVQWMQLEVGSIGSPDDVADSDAGDPMDMWGWESAYRRLKAAGPMPVRLRSADPPEPAADPAPAGDAGGYTPEPYKADPDETVQCPMCGCMNSPDARFCDQCGVALTGFHPSIGEGARRIKTDLIAVREAALGPDGSGGIKIIAPGWGSSGYYSEEMLSRDGPQVFTTGTKMFWDHPTLTEEWERPERSLRDLAGELTGDAVFNAAGSDGPGLYAPMKVFGSFASAVNELSGMESGLGVSIRAYGKASVGEAEGQTGQIIDELVGAESVDFVTFPGAGGAVLSLFEAARQRLVNPTPKEETMEVEKDPKFVEVKAQRDRLLAEGLKRDAGDHVAVKLAEAKLPVVSRDKLKASLVVNPPAKDGVLDKVALEARIEEAVTAEVEYLAKLSGAGQIRGLGASGPGAEPDLTAELEAEFVRGGLTESKAKFAAAGRK